MATRRGEGTRKRAMGTRSKLSPRIGAARLMWIGAGLVTLVVLGALVLGTRQTSRTQVGLAAGDRAPDFTLADLKGKKVSLHSFLGHPVLLHFWAVDCTSCQAEQPTYLQALKDLGKRMPVVLAVDAWGESADYVKQYVQKANLQGIVLIDPSRAVFDGLYQGQGTPTTVYIDAEGVIRRSVIGPEMHDQIIANAQAISA